MKIIEKSIIDFRFKFLEKNTHAQIISTIISGDFNFDLESDSEREGKAFRQFLDQNNFRTVLDPKNMVDNLNFASHLYKNNLRSTKNNDDDNKNNNPEMMREKMISEGQNKKNEIDDQNRCSGQHPVTKNPLRLDYICYENTEYVSLKVQKFITALCGLTDHVPIYAKFEIVENIYG